MKHDEFVSMVTGELIISIGDGTFKDQVRRAVQMAMARGAKVEHDSTNE